MNKTRKAFTLVEVMVTAAIGSAILAITFVLFNSSTKLTVRNDAAFNISLAQSSIEEKLSREAIRADAFGIYNSATNLTPTDQGDCIIFYKLNQDKATSPATLDRISGFVHVIEDNTSRRVGLYYFNRNLTGEGLTLPAHNDAAIQNSLAFIMAQAESGITRTPLFRATRICSLDYHWATALSRSSGAKNDVWRLFYKLNAGAAFRTCIPISYNNTDGSTFSLCSSVYRLSLR